MVPIYLVNLDRRPDKLAYMAAQLDALGLPFERLAAIDGRNHPDGPPDTRIARTEHLIPMALGSQCYAASFLAGLEKFVITGAEAALFLQDDCELAEDLPAFLQDLSWLPAQIGLVQMEKWVERRPQKLVGPAMPTPVAGRGLHRLHSRTGGAACFLIRARAARLILSEVTRMNFPTDHLLFSPNVSPVFDRIGVGIVRPALAVQRMEELTSDLNEWRRPGRKKRPALRRALTEVNRAHRQIAAMIGGARWRDVRFERRPQKS